MRYSMRYQGEGCDTRDTLNMYTACTPCALRVNLCRVFTEDADLQASLVHVLQNRLVLSALHVYTQLTAAAYTSCALRVNLCCVFKEDADLQACLVRDLQNPSSCHPPPGGAEKILSHPHVILHQGALSKFCPILKSSSTRGR